MTDESQRIAVLIDSDNVSATHIANVLAELARFGRTSVRRMYGDWTSPQLGAWKTAANEHSLQPVQQFSYTTGKNSTDSALIIDAMDLLHQGHSDMFAIVSSDSDFTRLASRLRESGAQVFGFGERKTPEPFVKACDRFFYFDALVVSASQTDSDGEDDTDPSAGDPGKAPAKSQPGANAPADAKTSAKELRSDTKLVALLRDGIASSADDSGWAYLGGVGSTIQKRSPDFDPRNWGYAKLGDLIKAVGLFEVRGVKAANGGIHLRARIVPKKK